MKKGIDDWPKLDIDYILSVGQEIPTERAIEDVSPVSWNDSVLNGDYVDQTLIKFDNNSSQLNVQNSSENKILRKLLKWFLKNIVKLYNFIFLF